MRFVVKRRKNGGEPGGLKKNPRWRRRRLWVVDTWWELRVHQWLGGLRIEDSGDEEEGGGEVGWGFDSFDNNRRGQGEDDTGK